MVTSKVYMYVSKLKDDEIDVLCGQIYCWINLLSVKMLGGILFDRRTHTI